MFHVKNHKQHNIFDPWGHLGPKRRKLLDHSWAGLFQQKILPALPVESLRKHYDDWNGRPTKELYSGVEATMSEFDRRTGVKHLRVRGMKAVSFAAFMKAIGLNIFRAARYKKQKGSRPIQHCGILMIFLAIRGFVKEQFKRRTQIFAALCINFRPINTIRMKMAF